LPMDDSSNGNSTLIENYYHDLPANNIDLIAKKVEIIKLDCHHYNILDTHYSTISTYLNSDQFCSVQRAVKEAGNFGRL
jgi:hypothetical protein